MSHDPTWRVAITGGGVAAASYAALSPQAGLTLCRATLEDALADPGVRGVIVTAPLADRPAAALAAIARGKPVLTEAPLADSVAGAAQVREAAAAANVPVMTAHPWRWHDAARSFRATVDSGELGPPAFFHWVNEEPVTGLDDTNPASGVTAGVDLAIWLLGDEPETVFARRSGLGGVSVSLRFRGGANALIGRRGVAPASAAGPGFAWLIGPRGEVRWDQRTAGVTLRGDASAAPEIGPGCLAADVAAAVAGWRAEPVPDPGERELVATLAAVNAAIEQGRPITIVTGAARGDAGNE